MTLELGLSSPRVVDVVAVCCHTMDGGGWHLLGWGHCCHCRATLGLGSSSLSLGNAWAGVVMAVVIVVGVR